MPQDKGPMLAVRIGRLGMAFAVQPSEQRGFSGPSFLNLGDAVTVASRRAILPGHLRFEFTVGRLRGAVLLSEIIELLLPFGRILLRRRQVREELIKPLQLGGELLLALA